MKMKNMFMISVLVVICVFLFAACDEGTGIKENGKNKIVEIYGGELLLIEGGTFKMGSPYATGNANERLHRDVTVSSFYMGKYEVTQEQWKAVMENRNPSYWHGGTGRETFAGEVQDKRPVEQISWFDAVTFCNEVSILETLTPYYQIDKSYIEDPNFNITENNLTGTIALTPAAPAAGASVDVVYTPGTNEDSAVYTIEWFKLAADGKPGETPDGTGTTSPELTIGDWIVSITCAETEKKREWGFYVINSALAAVPGNIIISGLGKDGKGIINTRITATYSGSGVTYEWYKDGKPFSPRATGANLQADKTDKDGVYTVRVSVSGYSPKFSPPIYITDPIKWLITTDDSSGGYRLPTEAQWEYACRAGSSASRFYGGYDFELVDYAWFNENSYEKKDAEDKPIIVTHQVGLKKPNAWGLYDMYGNVREWCWDWYNDSYDNAGGNNNPKGAVEGTARVMRGGGANGSGANLRSASRDNLNPIPPQRDSEPARNSYNGMRLVRPFK